jgi:hypothetical protein
MLRRSWNEGEVSRTLRAFELMLIVCRSDTIDPRGPKGK